MTEDEIGRAAMERAWGEWWGRIGQFRQALLELAGAARSLHEGFQAGYEAREAEAEVAALTAQVAALEGEVDGLQARMEIAGEAEERVRELEYPDPARGLTFDDFKAQIERVSTETVEAVRQATGSTDPARAVTLILTREEANMTEYALHDYLNDPDEELGTGDLKLIRAVAAKLRARSTDAPERGSRGL